jgi:hypothetical protein
MRRWCVALAVLASAAVVPARADAEVSAASLFLPFGMYAALQDPEKPMCVGIQTSPVWGDKGNYTGPCRYGAPLGPMNAAVNWMDRKRAANTAREYGLADRFAVRLETELDTIARLPFMTGVARLKRHAPSETRAAKDQGDSKKSSWLKCAAVTCAIFGSLPAEGELLWQIYIKNKRPDSDVAKAFAIGCSLAVVAPPLNRWIKSKGYGMGD